MAVRPELDADPAARSRRLLAEARTVQADLAAFLSSSRAQLAEGFGPPAVTAEYGADGVLAYLRIDGEARKQLSEAQLLAQLEAALIVSPAVGVGRDPHALAARLNALVASAAARTERLPRDEFSTRDGALTLQSVDGRPVGVTTRPGWVLSEPSTELGATIVRLARQAAAAAEDERGTV
ncbi:hypothetical protein ACFVU2_20350 [Leifsonia sp. NPDC058194]|uniref:hypothetical protein n=1 Tax=Leifsonia sp. NPDC058194 TaxID=3346374 RepID=UPI0036DF2117